MKHIVLLAAFLPFLGTAFGQASLPYCDEKSGICFQANQEPERGIVVGSIWPEDVKSSEFIGVAIAPNDVQWVGYSLVGGMTNTMIIVSWRNGTSFVGSPRLALDFVMPTYYPGPVITPLSYSSKNETHWKFVYRCQNCTSWSWTNGTRTMDSDFEVQSWAASLSNVTDPTVVSSSIQKHSYYGYWGEIIAKGRTADYAKYLNTTSDKLS